MKAFDEFAKDSYQAYCDEVGADALYPALVTCDELDIKSREWFEASIKAFPCAAVMYEAYWLGVNGEDRNGNPLPTYEQMSDDLKECWLIGVADGVRCAASVASAEFLACVERRASAE